MHCLNRLLAFTARAMFVSILLTAAPVWAATWTVNAVDEPLGGIDSASCTSITCTLRDAINVSASGDTIQFAAALDGQTIALSLFSNPSGCVTSSATTCGDGGTLSTQFGPSAVFISTGKVLTIDATVNGLQLGVTLSASNAADCTAGTCFRLFDVDTGSSLTLRGLALQNGVALGGGSDLGGGALGAGGAIFNQGTLMIDRCTLRGHRAQGGDGRYAVYRFGGGGSGANATDMNGLGGGPNGGAVGVNSLTANGGPGAAGGFGGGGGVGGFGVGLTGFGGAGGNGGFGGGGGIGGIGRLTSGVGGNGGFGGGSAEFGNNGFGGGIGFGGGGAGLGGAIFNDAGNVTLTNSTFSGNTAQGGGNGSIVGNGSGYGGALFNYNGQVSLSFVTIAGNSVSAGIDGVDGSADGGAIYSLGDSAAACGAGGNPCLAPGESSASGSATLTVNQSIAANSTGGTYDLVTSAINNATSTSSGTGNLVMANGGFAGTIVSTANPQLGALAANGFGVVMLPQAGSPVIDAVPCVGTATDQRGIARPQGAACDIGAVELKQTGLTVQVSDFGNGNNHVTATAGATAVSPISGISSCGSGSANGTCTAYYNIESSSPPSVTLTLAPASGWHITSVMSDTCTGSLSGDSYIIAALTTNCTVSVIFAVSQTSSSSSEPVPVLSLWLLLLLGGVLIGTGCMRALSWFN